MSCFLTAAALLLLTCSVQCQLQCLDEDGKGVNWYVMYKLPKRSEDSNKLVQEGVAYAYVTSSNPSSDWVLSEISINDSKSIPGRLLQPLYKSEKAKLFHALYNDDPPTKDQAASYGHTKGVVMVEGNRGVWLVHSVPNFPIEPRSNKSTKNDYLYPLTATKFAQSFLCVSFQGKDLDEIGTQLRYNKPKLYSTNIPKGFNTNYPNLTLAAKNKYIKKAPWNRKVELTSAGGTRFTSYAKAGKFAKELYDDWLAVDLKSDLNVETWSNGKGDLPNDCRSKFKVKNVREVGMKFSEGTSILFKNSVDHSKWAVTEKGGNGVVCIGDINRMEAQLNRGGGTVCFTNSDVWKRYSKSIVDVEPCSRSKKPKPVLS